MEKRTIWLRLGVTLELDNIFDERQIFAGDEFANMVLARLLQENRYKINGESYIPACMVAEFNKKYGTAYDDSEDVVFDW